MLRAVRYFAISLFSIVLASSIGLSEQPGSIKGVVLDKDTREPLAGANILLTRTTFGASTDGNGRFVIQNVPPGQYTAEIRMLGYQTANLTDLVISPTRATSVRIELQQSLIESQEVTVQAGFFRNDDISEMNSVSFNAQEIRRSPGSADDVSRVLMALPSVSSVSDNANDLAVRGGSPMENGFYVDGIPIPNINHFPVEGSTGGPIGLLNIDFIKNVDFITSGFPANYGDRLSSVVNITEREGSIDGLQGKTFFSFAGFGGVAEGPLPSESGSWMLSVNKSYLDLLVNAIGTGAAPRYGDIQGKVVLALAPGHKLTVLDVYGQSQIDFSKKNAIDLGQRIFGVNRNYQNSGGMNWQAVWSPKYSSSNVLSVSTTEYEAGFKKVSTETDWLTGTNRELNFSFRSEHVLLLGKRDRLEFGAEARLDRGVFDTYLAGDTNRLGGIDPTLTINKTENATHVSGFATAIVAPWSELSFSFGLRVEHYGLNKQTEVSPRFVATYSPSELLTFKASTGIFFQQNPLLVLAGNPAFESLATIRAMHYGIGMEYFVRPDTRLTVDVYDKEYDRMPLNPADPTMPIVDNAVFSQRFTIYPSLVSTGKAYTRGIEVMLQKKMAEDLYGLVSASYFRSRYQDYTGIWRDRLYDNKLLFSVIGGYKIDRNWEVSARWTYAGGGPYTPFNETLSRQFGLGIIDPSRANDERRPDYHSLNLRIDRKYFFEQHMLDIYLSVWNAYNRKNVAQYFWNNTTNAQDIQYQWGLLPVVGVEYEF
jgi:hypothetical protein